MAALAVVKIFAAERPPVVVTRAAARCVLWRKVHRGQRRRDLSPASRARFYRVAARAVHRLQMLRVRESGRVSLCPVRSFLRTSRLMARAARRHRVARARRVTLETAIVRARARRNRKTCAAAIYFMTARAIRLRLVLRMVESRGKSLQPRKAFDARRRVTNRANRRFIAFVKLLFVTARARDVSHIFNGRRIIRANVTNQARQASVRRVRVFETRKVGLRV